MHQKKTSDELPSSSVDYLKEKLVNALQKNVVENESESSENEKSHSNEVALKTQLDGAKKKIGHLSEKIDRQHKDIKLLKHALNESNRMCVAKDLKIERLEKELRQTKIKTEKNEKEKEKCEAPMFGKFDDKIDSSALNQLQNIPPGMKNDSTFVLTLVRYFYRDVFRVLLARRAIGIQNSGKMAMTPTTKKHHN